MRKLMLNVDALRVESFEATSPELREDGSVRGYAVTADTNCNTQCLGPTACNGTCVGPQCRSANTFGICCPP
ncbi:MAG: hypothetical protein JO306_13275 [Gemmatimonadetes bacterium]|nr:hypothetical protein [Gemmatimonadota bacterium]